MYSTARRTAANTPQQALTLLNDPTFVEAARALAARVLAAGDPPGEAGDRARIDRMFQRALCRPASAKEGESLAAFLREGRDHFRAHPDDARKLLAVGQSPPPDPGLPGGPAEAAA